MIEFLREKKLDGVVSILCENGLEIETVADALKDSEFKNFTLYNPKYPHNTKPTELLSFLKGLRKCKDSSERKGKTHWKVFILFIFLNTQV